MFGFKGISNSQMFRPRDGMAEKKERKVITIPKVNKK